MLTLPPGVRLFVATERVDGRKGMDGLSVLVRSRFGEDPLSGTMFLSRRADRVRVLYRDRDGYVLLSKRLEKGTYRLPWQAEQGGVVIEAAELLLVLEGIEVRGWVAPPGVRVAPPGVRVAPPGVRVAPPGVRVVHKPRFMPHPCVRVAGPLCVAPGLPHDDPVLRPLVRFPGAAQVRHVRRAAALAVALATVGCGSATARPSSGARGDAGDGRVDAPSFADGRGPETSRPDARRAAADTGPRDAPASDGRPPDAGPPAEDAARDAMIADANAAMQLSLSLPLVPAFSPGVHDYYVRCSAGTNAIVVSMTAASGSTIALAQPMATAPSAGASVPVDVAEGGAIVVDELTGDATDAYWIRCLPADFAELTMTPHPEAGAPTAGYYLVGDISNDYADAGYATVLDPNGVPVWFDRTATHHAPVNVDSLTPGAISFVPYVDYTFSDTSQRYELHDLAPATTTYVAPVGAPLDMHELRLLPGGNQLVLAAPISKGVDLTGLSTFGANEDMVECVIQELDPTGAVVWQWSASDHFDPVQDSTFPVVKSLDSRNVVIVYHCNSIDVAADGDLLVSARSMDSVFLVSRATGAVVWKMGGKPYTKDGATYLAVEHDPLTSFYRQHDARFQPDGTISMFDDQTEMPGPARAVIYSYDVTAGTATMVWQYLGLTPSSSMGSFRILPDGSRVIGWGLGGAAGRTFTEVDENGNDLLDFAYGGGDGTYRAVKVPTTELDLAVLRSSAGSR